MLGAGQDTSKSAQAVVTISLGITIISSNNSEDHPCLEPPSAFCMPPFPPAAQTECFSSISGGYGLLKPVIWMNGPWSLTQKVEKHDAVLPPPVAHPRPCQCHPLFTGQSWAAPVSPHPAAGSLVLCGFLGGRKCFLVPQLLPAVRGLPGQYLGRG